MTKVVEEKIDHHNPIGLDDVNDDDRDDDNGF